MEIDFSIEKRGPGVWILNTGLLSNENYRMGIEELLEKRKKEDGMYLEDKRLWWQNVKYEIK